LFTLQLLADSHTHTTSSHHQCAISNLY